MRAAENKKPGIFSHPFNSDRTTSRGLRYGDTPSRSSKTREEIISQEALRDIRSALLEDSSHNSIDDDLVGMQPQIFSTKKCREITMSDGQMDKMSQALTSCAKAEARQRVQAMRRGEAMRDVVDLPRLHKAQKITFDGRSVNIHLGSRGAAGRNIVALPSFIQTDDAAVRMGRGFDVLDVKLNADGKQTVSFENDRAIKGGRNVTLNLCFSDQQENLRNSARGQDR